jgi:hypothetical protein
LKSSIVSRSGPGRGGIDGGLGIDPDDGAEWSEPSERRELFD